MSSVWNNRIAISLFGESHGSAMGVTINNLPAGEYIDVEKISKFMSRINVRRDELDFLPRENVTPHIMSGIYNDRTTGSPLCAFVRNYIHETEKSADSLDRLARAGHADYTGAVRYKGFNDVRDGGHMSEKIIIPICFAGAVCGQILERRGIYTGAHIASLGTVKDNPFDSVRLNREQILSIREKKFPVISDSKGWLMAGQIAETYAKGDTLGGVVECAVVNVPAGIGSPVFDGLESTVSQLVFSIPHVSGIEFGNGFRSCMMTGTQNNDAFYVNDHGHVLTETNNHGGILGGISSGMPIVFRAGFRPSPSVAVPQESVDLKTMTGRSFTSDECDVCEVTRAVACVEAVANIAVLSHMIDYPNFC
ncbi:MAG: chorismate synthase [Ruminococcus sp.]|nr:chorismate synthase [Ruminococcus sp.]